MNKLYIILLSTIVFLGLYSNAYATNYCEDANAELCWLFESTGSPTTDSTTNGRDGTVNNATYTTTTPPSSGDGFNGTSIGYYVFDGGIDNIYLADIGFTRTAGQTFSAVAWVYAEETQGDQYNTILGVRLGSTGGDLWKFNYDKGSNTTDFQYDPVGSGGIANSSTVTFGEWIHLAGVYDGTDIKFYINGVLEGTDASVPNAHIDEVKFAVGDRADALGNEEFLGKVDEVGVFSRELSLSEIQDIMANGLVKSSSHPIPTATELRGVTLRNVTVR